MDSPYCPNCLLLGKLSNTYKVVGMRAYKCGTCKKTHPHDLFEKDEFLWAAPENAEWKAAIQKRLLGSASVTKDSVTKAIKARFN